MQSPRVPNSAVLTSESSSLEPPHNRQRKSLENCEVRPASHYGIDEVVEDGADIFPQHAQYPQQGNIGAAASKQQRFSGIPTTCSPPSGFESDVVHNLIHVNCTPTNGVSVTNQRLVATIFYKNCNHYQAPTTNTELRLKAEQYKPSATSTAQEKAERRRDTVDRQIPSNLAPTILPTDFPMELPAEDSEAPRDGLYGSYVSPICIAAFLHLMSTFPHHTGKSVRELVNDEADPMLRYNGYGSDLKASHRYLDDALQPHVVEIILSPIPALGVVYLRRHEQLYRFEREWNVEVILQIDTLWRRHPRLVVFDMDSTLIKQEVIDLLAESLTPEIAARVTDITNRAMGGELQFEEAFRERVHLLTGLPSTLFDSLRSHLNVTNGVHALLRALRRLGVRTAVLSGGFQPLTEWLANELGINYAYANHVLVDANGCLTGDVQGVIVGRERKCELLKQIAAKEDIDLRQTIAVGDGANDLLMLATAGLGVAWHAKPVVQLEADARLNRPSLLDLLYLLGFTSAEIAELAADKESLDKNMAE